MDYFSYLHFCGVALVFDGAKAFKGNLRSWDVSQVTSMFASKSVDNNAGIW